MLLRVLGCWLLGWFEFGLCCLLDGLWFSGCAWCGVVFCVGVVGGACFVAC